MAKLGGTIPLPALRTAVIGFVVFAVFTQVLILTPEFVETEPVDTQDRRIPKALLYERHFNDPDPLAPGIPADRIPEYSILGFDFISSEKSVKQWKIVAHKTNMYKGNELVHARDIQAWIYEGNDGATQVIGQEAKYFMNQKNLEIFGSVVTEFPDGFILYSEYLRYQPENKIIEVPVDCPTICNVRAEGSQKENSQISFTSTGMHYHQDQNIVVLPQDAVFHLTKKSAPTAEYPKGKEEVTTIKSDFALIRRTEQVAEFKMYATRPLKERFVQMTQEGLYVQSRTLDLDYKDYAESGQPNYMVARDDVYIEEFDEEEQRYRYSTSGKAEFDAGTNDILLTQYPQVYQGADTITGQKIIIHRDTDIVEIKYSNAFSAGEED